MEIHFYEEVSELPENVIFLHGWYETEMEIRRLLPEIHTTQMGILNTKLLDMGYRIFIHPMGNGEEYEISYGGNTCTDKEIRPIHNLFKMWENGAFFMKDGRVKGF